METRWHFQFQRCNFLTHPVQGTYVCSDHDNCLFFRHSLFHPIAFYICCFWFAFTYRHTPYMTWATTPAVTIMKIVTVMVLLPSRMASSTAYHAVAVTHAVMQDI